MLQSLLQLLLLMAEYIRMNSLRRRLLMG